MKNKRTTKLNIKVLNKITFQTHIFKILIIKVKFMEVKISLVKYNLEMVIVNFIMIFGFTVLMTSCKENKTQEIKTNEKKSENYEENASRIYMNLFYYQNFILDSVKIKDITSNGPSIVSLSSVIREKEILKINYNENLQNTDSSYEEVLNNSYLNEEYIFAFEHDESLNSIEKVLFKWKKGDITFYKTKSSTFSIQASHDILNKKAVMINNEIYIDATSILRPNASTIIGGEELYDLSKKYTQKNYRNNYDSTYNSTWLKFYESNFVSKNTSKKDTIDFISYNFPNEPLSEYSTEEMYYAQVKFFSKREDRRLLKTKTLTNVYGVNQFLMDHDLTTGFVHPYTYNFHKKLKPNDFVLKAERSKKRVNEAKIYYTTKKELSINDKLGENICFARQWKLSEININDDQIFLKQCNYTKSCECLQTKSTAKTYFKPEIPLYTENGKIGLQNITSLNKVGVKEGGGVDIVWYNKQGEIMFINMFSSIKNIFAKANEIKRKYQCDPTIVIYDAGTYAMRFKAKGSIIYFDEINQKLGDGEFLGAGFGFIKN